MVKTLETKTQRMERRNRVLKGFLVASLLGLFVLAMFKTPVLMAFADANSAAGKAVDIILKALRLMMVISGALFLILGIVQWLMNNDNDDGPEQKKAIRRIISGVVLLASGLALIMGLGDDIKSIISDVISES